MRSCEFPEAGLETESIQTGWAKLSCMTPMRLFNLASGMICIGSLALLPLGRASAQGFWSLAPSRILVENASGGAPRWMVTVFACRLLATMRRCLFEMGVWDAAADLREAETADKVLAKFKAVTV